jgi:hypothetical protein
VRGFVSTDPGVVRQIAKRAWYLQFGSEVSSRSALVTDLQPHFNARTKKITYSLQSRHNEPVKCCSNFYMRAVGVHETKMLRVSLSFPPLASVLCCVAAVWCTCLCMVVLV